MDKSQKKQNHAEPKNPDTKVQFYLHSILNQAKQTHGDRNQNTACLLWNEIAWERGTEKFLE